MINRGRREEKLSKKVQEKFGGKGKVRIFAVPNEKRGCSTIGQQVK